MPNLLNYRSWQGSFHSAWWTIWPIARVSLGIVLRRWMFWTLYAFGLLLFFMFFFGNFLLAWFESAAPTPMEKLGRDPTQLIAGIRRALNILNGSHETFQYFFWYQGGIVVVTLALVGALIVGNDFTYRSLVFYLAKPISRWHYLFGKFLAVFLIVQMMTTLPALGLFAQHTLDDWQYLINVNYFRDLSIGKSPAGIELLLGVIGYGTLLATFLSILLVATASWMRRTMPLIMIWMSLFFFVRLLANILVDGLQLSVRFRLIDLWNNMTILGQGLLGFRAGADPPRHPEWYEALIVLVGVCAICLIYLNHRTRGVEIVS